MSEGSAATGPGDPGTPTPGFPRGYPISDYSDGQLIRLAQWIRSDGILRTEDELRDEMMHELAFQRHGKNIIDRLTAAIRRSQPENHRPQDTTGKLPPGSDPRL